jgi:predicted Fe-S protein YdhL (DUF1289 family)
MTTHNAFVENFDPDSHAGPMPSPCISVCTMNPRTGLCEGCFRTIDEIAQWSTATEDAKRSIWTAIKRRQDGN